MMIGQAHAKAQKLHERDRIRLGEVDVSTTYDRERGKEYVNYKCFDFTMADDPANAAQPRHAPPDANPVEGDESEEELPF